VTFNREIVFKTPKLDATKEFTLAVQGDSLGVGATVEADPANVMGAVITLGDQACLKIGGAFITSQTTTGAPSGINVSTLASGQIVSAGDAVAVGPAAMPIDVGGSTTAAFHGGPALVVARGGHEGVLLNDGRVLIVGGMRDGPKGDFAQDAEIFDPATGQFTTVSQLSGPTKGRMMNGSVVVTRVRFTATKLQDGKVLIVGGYGIDRKGLFGLGGLKKEVIGDAHLFDPATNTFERIGELEHSRHSHTATLLTDGRVLIAGGYSDSFWSRKKTLAPFELYDPKTKTFADETKWLFFTKGTIEKRMNHAAVLTDNGVLLAGGEHWDGGFLHFFGTNTLKLDSGSETFANANNSFAKSGNLAHARRYAAATVLASKDVIIAGGHDDKSLVDGIERWTQATGQWTEIEKLAHPRTNARLARAGDLTLVIGGFSMPSVGTGEVKDVDVFDATSMKLTTGLTLTTARVACSVTELKDGRVLVAGGFSGVTKDVAGMDGQAVGSTEIYSAP